MNHELCSQKMFPNLIVQNVGHFPWVAGHVLSGANHCIALEERCGLVLQNPACDYDSTERSQVRGW